MILRALSVFLATLWVAGPAVAACSSPNQADIYPTASVLPENLLRMYVYFTQPMDPESGLSNVRLLDSTGATVQGAFLANRDDLWSPDRRRLTLILDPSRVKTGLVAHEALGRALVEGQLYAVEVSGAALDANGCPLGKNTLHEFSVGEADLEPPNPALWKLVPPKAQSTDPLIVKLGSTHDHLSLAYQLRILDVDGGKVQGSIALGENESDWMFTPNTPWLEAPYALAIDERLEDLAGNRPGILFDRPLDQLPSEWENILPFTPGQ